MDFLRTAGQTPGTSPVQRYFFLVFFLFFLSQGLFLRERHILRDDLYPTPICVDTYVAHVWCVCVVCVCVCVCVTGV